jgi:hypothetical protein
MVVVHRDVDVTRIVGGPVEQPRARWDVERERLAIPRLGLLSRRSPGKPDAAGSWRRQVAGRDLQRWMLRCADIRVFDSSTWVSVLQHHR